MSGSWRKVNRDKNIHTFTILLLLDPREGPVMCEALPSLLCVSGPLTSPFITRKRGLITMPLSCFPVPRRAWEQDI